MNRYITKRFSLRLAITCLLALVALLSSCKKNDPAPSLTALEINSSLITSGSWKIQNVTIDGVDQSTLFTGLTLSFTSSTFTTSNGNQVWPASGTWSFINAEATKVLRSDNIEVTLGEISETKLVLSLPWNKTTFTGGRGSSLKGTHTFAFSK